MRKFLKKTKLAAWGLLGSLVLTACGSDEGGIKNVPRDRTLILGLPQMRDYDSFNPFIVGTQSPGFDYLFEPLYFYNAYVEKDHVIPWIAKSHEYNADYTEVTIHIRKGVSVERRAALDRPRPQVHR